MTAYSDYAYPHSERPASQPGMTLRDYFAGQVLAGMYAHGGMATHIPKTAEEAYDMANEMLKVRRGE